MAAFFFYRSPRVTICHSGQNGRVARQAALLLLMAAFAASTNIAPDSNRMSIEAPRTSAATPLSGSALVPHTSVRTRSAGSIAPPSRGRLQQLSLITSYHIAAITSSSGTGRTGNQRVSPATTERPRPKMAASAGTPRGGAGEISAAQLAQTVALTARAWPRNENVFPRGG